MNLITRDNVVPAIDSRFHRYLTSEEYELRTVPAKSLMSPNRVDIYIKYQLIKAWYEESASPGDNGYYEQLYLKTIKLFTRNRFTEPGDSDKSSSRDYLVQFNGLLKSIASNYDKSLGLVPVSEDGVPLDGAHRIAILALLDIDVEIVVIPKASAKYDLNHFKLNGANDSILYELAIIMSELEESLRLAIIWPNGISSLPEICQLYNERTIYSYSLKLDRLGVNNLCSIAYKNEEWVGGIDKSWSGAYRKGKQCFGKGGKTTFILYESYSQDQDIAIKEKIRSFSGGTKHSIHSTDNSNETLELLFVTFHTSSSAILNNIDLSVLSRVITPIKEYMDTLKLSPFIFTGSIVMELFSIRKANDIDVFTLNDYCTLPDVYGDHNDYLGIYGKTLSDYENNPTIVYNIMGFKFISLEELLSFKANRNEKKDIIDVKLINRFRYKNGISKFEYKMKIKDHMFFLKLNLKRYRKLIKKKIKILIKK
ncbi:hypothetical protein DS893_05475 [Vibrionales bacterium C3R12]|nr:hypothetical protein DS893_05475 [Vibrionales bacterium C3R12]